MVRGLYTSAAGMNAQQNNIDVTSNNIANVNTTAFKKDRIEFADLMYQSLNYTANATSESTNNPTGIDVGLGVGITGIQKSFLQGSLTETGNDLDIAIQGKGFFQIITPNGDTQYTRNGALQQGMLEASNVQLVNAMVDLITAQRAYEANSKSLQTTDAMLQTVNQLKR